MQFLSLNLEGRTGHVGMRLLQAAPLHHLYLSSTSFLDDMIYGYIDQSTVLSFPTRKN